MPGTLLGYVFNKAPSKSIPSKSPSLAPASSASPGPSIRKPKRPFEGGKLFTDDDMKAMEQITIS
ncbi:hypothetical protein PAAG_12297 [Paracoccidioides lutzii Pb01]|uniref:Uncharacterized protein n=1 Tax=Paracoccidioides lutzii (strain ATCC MYA-826 / Pb01) TaxID=502779 RepID=A0A0A2V4A4_PARBA|nr:hypothetical protein PAAG_12297 [Paracoccidioides lutzii Pb01]KGQ00990.1 hypothetical protein PAAG_12297 [Paracoccidioides lutzii Pb01]